MTTHPVARRQVRVFLDPWWARRWYRVAYLVLVALAMTYLASLHVSPDGYLYLQSSKYVFTSHALEGYNWIREPLYPLILRLERLALGPGDRGIIFVQASAVTASAHLVSSALLPRRPVMQTIAITLIALNPVSVMYAGSILQTVWIALALGGFAWLIARSWDTRSMGTWHILIATAVWITLAANLAFQLGYLGASVGAGIGAGLAWRGKLPRTRPGSRIRRVLIATAFAAAGAVAFGAVGLLAVAPWNAYKQHVLESASTPSNSVDSRGLATQYTGASSSDLVISVLSSPVERSVGLIDSSLKLASAKSGFVDENRIYTDVMLAWPCGALEEAIMINDARTEALSLVTPHCRSANASRALGLTVGPGYRLLAVAGLALALALVLLPFIGGFPQWLALLPQAQLLLMYAAVGLNFTRYGFPSYQFGIAALLLMALLSVRLVQRLFGIGTKQGKRLKPSEMA